MAKKYDSIKRNIIHGVTPNAGHFVKGKSGNQRGRPKAPKSAGLANSSTQDEFLKAAHKLIKVHENDREIQIPVHNAIRRAEIVSAMKGNSQPNGISLRGMSDSLARG